jgi:hypothetical protein
MCTGVLRLAGLLLHKVHEMISRKQMRRLASFLNLVWYGYGLCWVGHMGALLYTSTIRSGLDGRYETQLSQIQLPITLSIPILGVQ